MPASEKLLTEYARDGSERAFRDLVSAYVGFVYSTALRLESAQDVRYLESLLNKADFERAHRR